MKRIITIVVMALSVGAILASCCNRSNCNKEVSETSAVEAVVEDVQSDSTQVSEPVVDSVDTSAVQE